MDIRKGNVSYECSQFECARTFLRKVVIGKSGQNPRDTAWTVRGLHENEQCDVLKNTLTANATDLSLNDHNQFDIDQTSEHHCRPNTRALECFDRRPT